MKTITNLVFLLFISISFSQISINEIDADQSGTDVTEFVELRSDSPNFSLGDYILVFYNGQDDESYRTVDLTGFMTDAEGFFIIGSSATPGVDISIGTSNTIQNGPDAVAIYQDVASNFPNGTPVTNVNLIDAIVYGTADDDDAEQERDESEAPPDDVLAHRPLRLVREMPTPPRRAGAAPSRSIPGRSGPLPSAWRWSSRSCRTWSTGTPRRPFA